MDEEKLGHCHRKGGIPVEEFLRAAAAQKTTPHSNDDGEDGKLVGYYHRKGGIPVEDFLRAAAKQKTTPDIIDDAKDEKLGFHHRQGGIPVEDFLCAAATPMTTPDLIDAAIGRTAVMMEERKRERGQMNAGRPSGMHVKDFLEASYRDGLLQRNPDVTLNKPTGQILEAPPSAPRLSEEEILKQLALRVGGLDSAAFAKFKRAVIEVFSIAESTRNTSVESASSPDPVVALFDDEEVALRKALQRHAEESQGVSSDQNHGNTGHLIGYDMGDGADY